MEYPFSRIAFQVLIPVICLVVQRVQSSKLAPSALTVDPPPMIFDDYDPACFNFTHGNFRDMEFYSPAYPDQYPNKIDCVMYLQAPPGFIIDLYFKDKFSIEETEDCKFDFIELRDGPFGYSKLIARFCGEGFPVSIFTTTRFLWARFSSDDLVQFDGFRAVYEYKIDQDYEHGNSVTDTNDVCRIYMDNMGLDGEINSKVFPLANTAHRDYPINQPIDCTWEMLAERGNMILLSEVQIRLLNKNICEKNMIQIYDGTTSQNDCTGVYCSTEPVQDYTSQSNRVYLRIFGSKLSDKPVLFGRYTVFKPARKETGYLPCAEGEFHCEDMCLNQALVCNGHKNCPITGADEQGCQIGSSSGNTSEEFPMLMIILAGVGGLILTVVIICICATCLYKKKRKPKPGLQKTDSQKRNALEIAVSDSTNTAYQLAKQSYPGSYCSLQRPSGQATMMHRGSFSSKVPSEGDYGDQMSESSTYKKFLQMEQQQQNLDDDSSRCPSPYSPGFTTIIEQHPVPPGMTELSWNYPNSPEVPAMPSLAENLSKLKQYTNFNRAMQNSMTGMDSPNSGMTMDFHYDPSTPVYPATKFRIKSPEVKYGWNTDTNKSGNGDQSVKSLTFKNQDAEVAPDLTREIESTG